MIERHPQHDKLLARKSQQGQMSRQLRILAKGQMRLRYNARQSLTVFFDTTQNVVYIVREESFSVKHGLDHPSDRFEAHSFVMGVLIPLQYTSINIRYPLHKPHLMDPLLIFALPS